MLPFFFKSYREKGVKIEDLFEVLNDDYSANLGDELSKYNVFIAIIFKWSFILNLLQKLG